MSPEEFHAQQQTLLDGNVAAEFHPAIKQCISDMSRHDDDYEDLLEHTEEFARAIQHGLTKWAVRCKTFKI